MFPDLNPPLNWFERRLRRGGCLILLDGLDEVADTEQRKVVAAWVDRQIEAYAKCRFIVTARPQGYRDAPLTRANVVEVLPFTADQVRRFVNNWYLANEIYASMGQRDAAVRHRATIGAADLLGRLRNTPALADLTVNPLLLTMIAMVHRYHGALPGSRIQLYADICQVLLERWRQSLDIQDSLRAEQKLLALRPLAALMMERNVREIGVAEALEVVGEPLSRVGWGERAPLQFLREIESGSGLFLEREEDVWSFAHLSFQEYLTAMHWRQTGTPVPDWSSKVSESWWHETCRLHAAQADATPIVEACLQSATVSALTLAAECLEEASELDARVRTALEARVVADLESPDSVRRRLAAEVQLTRRLKSLQRIDDDREIDLTYITCAEYQLFLDDLRAQGDYRQPDHWSALHFPRGQSRDPVTGVRASDAEAFCSWLTERRGGQTQFRLPRTEEALEHASRIDRLASWCHSSASTHADYSLIGLSSTTEQELRTRILRSTGASQYIPAPPKIGSSLMRDLDLNFDIRTALILDRNLDIMVTKVRKIVNTLAQNFEQSMIQMIVRDISLDYSLTRDIDIDLDHRRALDLGLDLNRDLERARDLALNRARARIISFVFDLDFAEIDDLTTLKDSANLLANIFNKDNTVSIYKARTIASTFIGGKIIEPIDLLE